LKSCSALGGILPATHKEEEEGFYSLYFRVKDPETDGKGQGTVDTKDISQSCVLQ
jgi:hypothetical protein